MSTDSIKELFKTGKIYTYFVGLLFVVASNNKARRNAGIEYEVVIDTNYLPVACFCCQNEKRTKLCPDWQYNKKKSSYCGHMQAAYERFEKSRSLLWNDPLVEVTRNGKKLVLRWNQLTDEEQNAYHSYCAA